MWHKGTSVYISYCQLQQVTQPQCKMLHSYQQHRAAIYIYIYINITICVICHKGTSVYISYCQLPQFTKPHCITLHSFQQNTAAIYIYIYIYINISVCVRWHKGTSVYISYCQLRQVTQPHCNMLHFYQTHSAAIYIYFIYIYIFNCLWHVTQRNISIHFILLTTACHKATLHYATLLSATYSIYIYISVSVSCDTKENQYTFRNASYSRSQSHTALCYIAINNIQQLYIYMYLCHMTQRNIIIHFLLPATAGHTANCNNGLTSNKLTIHMDCLYCPNVELQENPSNGSRYTARI